MRGEFKTNRRAVEVLHAEFSQESPREDCFVTGGVTSAPFFYVLITPLLGSCLGRQGSSGRGSWANTESSPEEQVLLES